MITEGILNVFFGILDGLLDLLPDVSLSINTSFFLRFLEVIRLACYLLPMTTINAILYIVFQILILRIAIALLKTIKTILF